MIKFVLLLNVMGLEGDTRTPRPHVFRECSFCVFHALTLKLDMRVTFLPPYSSKMTMGRCKSNADDTDHQKEEIFPQKLLCVVATHEYTCTFPMFTTVICSELLIIVNFAPKSAKFTLLFLPFIV